MKLIEILNEEYQIHANGIPEILYHATYKPILKSIKEFGLGGGKKQRKMWDDSKPGVVYLARTKDIAESYAESSDVAPESWLDNIVILECKTEKLNKNNFFIDKNVIDNEGDTFEYHGVIPWTEITKVN